MYRACIAVVDASRARLFTFERTSEVEGVKDDLVEQRDLIDPARRLRPVDLFSDSRPGSSRTGDKQFGFDDHRDHHVDELDAEFAQSINDELVALLKSSPASRMIVCASPRMLGELRRARRGIEIEIDELPRNLVKLTIPQLREHLTSYGLLPPAPPRRTLER